MAITIRHITSHVCCHQKASIPWIPCYRELSFISSSLNEDDALLGTVHGGPSRCWICLFPFSYHHDLHEDVDPSVCALLGTVHASHGSRQVFMRSPMSGLGAALLSHNRFLYDRLLVVVVITNLHLFLACKQVIIDLNIRNTPRNPFFHFLCRLRLVFSCVL